MQTIKIVADRVITEGKHRKITWTVSRSDQASHVDGLNEAKARRITSTELRTVLEFNRTAAPADKVAIHTIIHRADGSVEERYDNPLDPRKDYLRVNTDAKVGVGPRCRALANPSGVAALQRKVAAATHSWKDLHDYINEGRVSISGKSRRIALDKADTAGWVKASAHDYAPLALFLSAAPAGALAAHHAFPPLPPTKAGAGASRTIEDMFADAALKVAAKPKAKKAPKAKAKAKAKASTSASDSKPKRAARKVKAKAKAQVAAPKASASKPKASASKASASKPKASASKPKASASKPKPKASASKASASKPKASASKPKAARTGEKYVARKGAAPGSTGRITDAVTRAMKDAAKMLEDMDF